MIIQVEKVTGGSLYFFEGTQRFNITRSLIENGQSYVLGAPIRTTIDNDIVLLF